MRPNPKDLIPGLIEKIKSQEPKLALKKDPEFVLKEKDKYKKSAENNISILESRFESLKPFIVNLKSRVKDITEQTRDCAVYLLFGSILKKWEAIFILARAGRSYEAVELMRSLEEALDLIDLFMNSDKYLKKWFSGEIIPNRESRNIWGILAALKTRIYGSFSHYTHSGYVAMLADFVDPFTEDLDFDNVTGYFRTSSYTNNFKETLKSTIIRLKLLYLRDQDKYLKLDFIYNSLDF